MKILLAVLLLTSFEAKAAGYFHRDQSPFSSAMGELQRL